MDKRKTKQLKDSLTPEEIVARAQRARWRFRAIVRFVIQNLYWLDDVEDDVLGNDVQKNILLLTRSRKEKQGLLTLQDKGILSKLAEHRTYTEKFHLSRIIGGLKCFRQYPTHVKNELAGVTYFFYYGPRRTVVQQGHKSEGLYFIVTGNLTASEKFYDPILKETVSHDVSVMGPGHMFGEVELVHDIPRTVTVTTNTHVELLCLRKKDFDIVLKATVQEQWMKIQIAMSRFTYFEDWNEIQIRDCCILAKLKTFPTDQTILGDGFGRSDYVYFILTGRCQVVEHLLVTSDVKDGRKRYKLYVPLLEELSPVVNQETLPKEEENLTEVEENLADEEPLADTQNAAKSKSSFTAAVSKVASEGIRKEINNVIKSKSRIKVKVGTEHSFIDSKLSQQLNVQRSEREISVASVTQPVSKLAIQTSVQRLPPSVETHFMQVCILNPTACFGIGENMKFRRVVAIKETECLLIPRYWLIQYNKGNIWNRVQQFLNKHIPTTKQVFKEFVNQRKWLAYRKKLFEDILMRRKNTNVNTISNVPYFIRINEEIDLH